MAIFNLPANIFPLFLMAFREDDYVSWRVEGREKFFLGVTVIYYLLIRLFGFLKMVRKIICQSCKILLKKNRTHKGAIKREKCDCWDRKLLRALYYHQNRRLTSQ